MRNVLAEMFSRKQITPDQVVVDCPEDTPEEALRIERRALNDPGFGLREFHWRALRDEGYLDKHYHITNKGIRLLIQHRVERSTAITALLKCGVLDEHGVITKKGVSGLTQKSLQLPTGERPSRGSRAGFGNADGSWFLGQAIQSLLGLGL
jgi:hypothetical protein